MVLSHGDEGGLVDVDDLLLIPAGNPGGAGNDDPVLAAVVMHLQGEPLPRLHLDPLDLVAPLLIQNRVGAPGAFPFFHEILHC